MEGAIVDETMVICPACGHSVALHCGLEGRCVVKMPPEFDDFDPAQSPECGCEQYRTQPEGTE